MLDQLWDGYFPELMLTLSVVASLDGKCLGAQNWGKDLQSEPRRPDIAANVEIVRITDVLNLRQHSVVGSAETVGGYFRVRRSNIQRRTRIPQKPYLIGVSVTVPSLIAHTVIVSRHL
jgi:hypothetical protein